LADEGGEEEEEKLFIPKGIEVFEINGPFFFGIANRLMKLSEIPETELCQNYQAKKGAIYRFYRPE
jgi:MFS superfamily sulfate permease-like transporter